AFESPYYPLKGPPETPEERSFLDKVISDESATVRAAIIARQSFLRSDPTEFARLNCADLAYFYHLCRDAQSLNPFANRKRCAEQGEAYEECLKLQEQYLREMDFTKAGLSKKEQNAMVEAADERYIQEMAKREREKLRKQAEESGIPTPTPAS
ncbi:hypothetical protein HK097_005145, partial [Rhizophlyctis rosea]